MRALYHKQTMQDHEITQFIIAAWAAENPINFPAPQPVSIERRHIPSLFTNNYIVSDKTDGVRQLLVCRGSVCTFVNRSFESRTANIQLPKCTEMGTILDGELLSDGTYIVYDVVMMAGHSTIAYRLPRRHRFIRELLYRTKDPKIKLKKFYKIKDFDYFCNDVLSNVGYKTDGLIFIPVDEPVKSGTQFTMFKWKPMEMNTIDFSMKKRPDGKIGMYIQDRGRMIFQQFYEGDGINGFNNNMIMESKLIDNKWVPIFERKDKNYPNSRFTFYKTLKNIKENIQITEFMPINHVS